MNTGAEINKILAYEILEYIKRILHQGQVRFNSGMQGWFKINQFTISTD